MTSINLSWMEPIDAAVALGGKLLDGQGSHPEARYAFLGVHPEKELVVRDGTVNGKPCDVVAALREAFAPTGPSGPHPWTGGWMGYFGYEFTRYLEPSLGLTSASTPDAVFEWFATGIVFDHHERTVTAYGTVMNLGEVSEQWEAPEIGSVPDVEWVPATDASSYKQQVKRVKEWIREGDLFQANIATRFDAPAMDGAAVFKEMARRNPSPYMCYLPYDDHTIVSNSPEQLFATKDGVICTRPIAGTRPRGEGDADGALAAELRADPKERAEHMMLVDLLRNDVSKVSQPGTTRVTEWMSIERYSHVMHLVSQVTGNLRPQADVMDCMAAIFPGGTITGAPKHRACMRIHETEPVPRGPYTGSAGFINHAGEASFNIMIRTMTITDKSSVHAGAGIVMDSDPEREWNESLQKASAFLNRPGGRNPAGVQVFDTWTPPHPNTRVPSRVLLIDNYDSFVENLRDYCEMLGATTRVIRTDQDWRAAAADFSPTHIILSPGPGHPADSGATLEIAKSDWPHPIMGVCLGHQALALADGGTIRVVPAVHGKVDHIQGEIAGEVARYHSLVADLPNGWIQTATLADGTLMAMRKGNRVGLQFHPESMGTPSGLELLADFLRPTLFETVRVKDGKPVRWDLHQQRLQTGAKTLGIPAPTYDGPWGEDGLLRISFGNETTTDSRPITPPKPLRLTTAKGVPMPAKCLEWRRLEEPEADDILYLNADGSVSELRFRNVLCLHEGVLYAPGPQSGALAGTSRQRILEAWDGPVEETLRPEQDGEWVATSVSGVCPIVFLDRERPVGDFVRWCQAVLDD